MSRIDTSSTQRRSGKSSPVYQRSPNPERDPFSLRLLELVSTRQEERLVRAKFRQLVLESLGATHCSHWQCNSLEQWTASEDSVSGDRTYIDAFLPWANEHFQQFVLRGDLQLSEWKPEVNHSVSTYQVTVPIPLPHALPEILCISFDDPLKAHRSLGKIAELAKALVVWLRSDSVIQNEWKLQTLATVIELVSQIEECTTRSAMLQKVVDQMALLWNCASTAIGIYKGKTCELQAISGSPNANRNSSVWHAFQQAITESDLRGGYGRYPAPKNEAQHSLLAHQQLADELHSESICTHRLQTVSGKCIGTIALACDQETANSERLQRSIRVAMPRIATAIQSTLLNTTPLWKRWIQEVAKRTGNRKAIWMTALFLGTAGVGFLPVTYKVRCPCRVEPTERRFVAAPFDGLLESSLVRPGTVVTRGQTMARMDGKEVRLQLASLTAEQQKSIRNRELELGKREIASAMMAELEQSRLNAEMALWNHRRDSLEIASPMDGIVLSGSQDHAKDVSVSIGQVLFEIAPLDSFKLLVEIPSEDRFFVREGMKYQVWIDGRENLPILGTINSIRPVSELRNSRNVFIAECHFEAPSVFLQPGMEGSARIDCDRQSLFWCLFHKPIGYLRSNMGL